MGIVQRQGLINSVITYSGIAIGFISLLVIQPRFLTTEEIGLTRVLFSFSALVATFMPFGMNSITLKYFPYFRNRDKGHYGFFLLMLLLPLAGFLLIGGILWLLRDFIISQYIEQSALFTEYFTYVYPLTFFLSLISVLNAYSYSLFKTTLPALVNDVIVRLLSIGLFTLYFIKAIDLDRFIFLFVAIYGIQLLVLAIYIFLIDNPSLRIDRSFLSSQRPREMIIYGLLLSFAALSSLGLKYLDVVMLGKYVPLSLVGIYSICAFIPTVIEAPLGALEKIGLAKISDGWAKKDMNLIREIYYKSSKYLFLAGGLLFLGINLNLDSLFSIIPNADFAAGKHVVLIISLGTLINMASGINDSIIYTSSKYIYGTYMLIALFVLAIINNMIFIPWLGINGAALATACSAIAFNVMKFVFIRSNFQLQPFTLDSIKIAVAIVSTWIVISRIPHFSSGIVDLLIRSLIITFLYAVIIIFMKVAPEFHHWIGWKRK